MELDQMELGQVEMILGRYILVLELQVNQVHACNHEEEATWLGSRGYACMCQVLRKLQ